jgi:NADH-quinone oxidoreductase subunit L
MSHSYPLLLIPLFPLLGAVFNLLVGRRVHKETVGLTACMMVGASAVVALYSVLDGVVPLVMHPDPAHPAVIHQTLWTWLHAADFNVVLGLQLDALSSVMVLVVTVVGFFIHLYAVGYMSHDKDISRFFGYFNLFVGAMLVLVLGDSLPAMFIGWEGVGLSSFLLIGFWYGNAKNCDAGRKAMVVNRIGDFAFLIGIFLTYYLIHSLTFADLDNAAKSGALSLAAGARGPFNMPWAFYVGLCFFIGACGKSAQIPLYVWLPDAMAGPTPVSALMHAATMVTAGVYMMARLHFLVIQSPTLMAIVIVIGVATALMAATIAIAQNDIKKVLAYSTVSQLGFMMIAVGAGAFGAAIFHLVTHACFKGLLFLGAGSVMHACNDQTDMREMGGLRKKMPVTAITFLIGTLAISGAPLLSGFFSKDEILAAAASSGTRLYDWAPALGWAVYAVGVLTAGVTAFYMFRAYFLTFEGETRNHDFHPHESPSSMTVPLGVLAAGAVLAGYLGIPGSHNFLHHWFSQFMGLGEGAAAEAGLGVTPYPGFIGHFVESSSRELALMVVAVLIATIAFFIARACYRRGPSEQAKSLAVTLSPAYKLISHKYYVDEAYDYAFVRPFNGTAKAAALFDRFAIDGVLVTGSAVVVGLVGRLVRVLQNGDVQRYLAAMVIGLAAILWFGSRPPSTLIGKADQFAPDLVHFDASVAAAGTARDLTYEWDFDDDGKFDARTSTPLEDHTYPTPGVYTVRLKVTDQRWGRTSESTIKVQAVNP